MHNDLLAHSPLLMLPLGAMFLFLAVVGRHGALRALTRFARSTMDARPPALPSGGRR